MPAIDVIVLPLVDLQSLPSQSQLVMAEEPEEVSWLKPSRRFSMLDLRTRRYLWSFPVNPDLVQMPLQYVYPSCYPLGHNACRALVNAGDASHAPSTLSTSRRDCGLILLEPTKLAFAMEARLVAAVEASHTTIILVFQLRWRTKRLSIPSPDPPSSPDLALRDLLHVGLIICISSPRLMGHVRRTPFSISTSGGMSPNLP